MSCIQFPFVTRIEFIRSNLSNFSAHVSGVGGWDAAAVFREAVIDVVCPTDGGAKSDTDEETMKFETCPRKRQRWPLDRRCLGGLHMWVS